MDRQGAYKTLRNFKKELGPCLLGVKALLKEGGDVLQEEGVELVFTAVQSFLFF